MQRDVGPRRHEAITVVEESLPREQADPHLKESFFGQRRRIGDALVVRDFFFTTTVTQQRETISEMKGRTLPWD